MFSIITIASSLYLLGYGLDNLSDALSDSPGSSSMRDRMIEHIPGTSKRATAAAGCFEGLRTNRLHDSFAHVSLIAVLIPLLFMQSRWALVPGIRDTLSGRYCFGGGVIDAYADDVLESSPSEQSEKTGLQGSENR